MKPTGNNEDQLKPVLTLVGAILVMASVAMRRCCVRPGGMAYRWTKERVRAQKKSDDNNRNQSIREHQKFLLQITGLGVFVVTFAVLVACIHWNVSPLWALAVVLSNGVDEWTQKWEGKKSEVNAFRRQLRERLAPEEKDTGADSDSSESYDPEKH